MKNSCNAGKGAAIVLLMLLFSGCGVKKNAEEQAVTSVTAKTALKDAVQTDYGCFSLPSGWVKNEEHSTGDKPFFVSEDYSGNGIPDNISVEYSTNHFAKENIDEFGKAILRQLSTQLQGETDGQVTASGGSTENGDPLLVYEFSLSDRTCTQYYIVGERCHVLIYETNLDNSEDCDAAAKDIVNSFQWK